MIQLLVFVKTATLFVKNAPVLIPINVPAAKTTWSDQTELVPALQAAPSTSTPLPAMPVMLAVGNALNITLQHALPVRIILFFPMVNAAARPHNFLILQPTDVSPVTLHALLVPVQPQMHARLAFQG